MIQRLRAFRWDETAQDLIEYSLLVSFVAMATLWIVVGSRPGLNAIQASANGTISNASAYAGS